MSKRILVVDDDPELQELVTVALSRAGYEVTGARDAREGLERLAREGVDVALLDIMMPGMDGLEMLSRLREQDKELRVIMMTAMSTPSAVISAMREHACDFLAKPFDMNELLSAVNSAFALVPQEIGIEVLSARPEWIELRVPCSMAALDPLERLMSQLKTDLPADTRDSITYAFREMLRNAIEHGGKNDPAQSIEVGYLRTPRIVLYRIKDPGEGFQIESLYHSAILNPDNDPMQHERFREQMGLRPGGFGILIARNMVDEMVYNERHNEVVLIKYLDAEESQSGGNDGAAAAVEDTPSL
ncbi:MAG TPA: response regulator [Pyrinomonadaceae bacterium]|jgi:CheY-like chemotaxis protein/anti-sigma regulatory factor (Ser/Thr protein kinase)